MVEPSALKPGGLVVVPSTVTSNYTGRDVCTKIVRGLDHGFTSPNRAGRVAVKLENDPWSRLTYIYPHELQPADVGTRSRQMQEPLDHGSARGTQS